MRKHHNKLYYGKYRYKTTFKMPGSLLFYPTTNEHLLHVKKIHPGYPDINYLADFIINKRNKMKFRFKAEKQYFILIEILQENL